MPTPGYAIAFAKDLKEFVDQENRAALAALRRGAGKPLGEVNEPYRYLRHWLANDRPDRDQACYLAASLFAIHQISWSTEGERPERTNLGASFRILASRRDSASIEDRFIALLNAHADDLATHLRHAVALLKSEDVPVDWAGLVADIERWDHPSRAVQRAWARAYWGSDGAAVSTTEPNAAPIPAAPSSDT